MVTTVVRTGPEEHRRSLKWVVVVGSVAGLLLLALLSTLLWAMGFFRGRDHKTTETEPLNGNGFYGNNEHSPRISLQETSPFKS
ncbi:putative Integrin alpha-PS2-like 2 [Homarus americanus]|uniref:Putative Integrin alpha-PS2-like 2 n=1 Tax=Homarus americanus TaxID=6706 RepID=A0A8J5J7P2_HOMAM|nr:putative Integrin alpha-PS2-like 2 [Homarus americanus]